MTAKKRVACIICYSANIPIGLLLMWTAKSGLTTGLWGLATLLTGIALGIHLWEYYKQKHHPPQ